MEKGTVKIFRFDPTVDEEPWYETNIVPPEAWKGVKVIDTLRYIYENITPDLSFREPCRQRVCGACMVQVNNKPVMACETFSEQNMVIEPIPKHRHIKDLVVEFKV